MQIENGAGDGKKLAVNGRNEAKVFAVIESEAEASTDLGQSYNINSGDITCSGDTTLVYFKNDEDTTIVLQAIAVGVRGSTVADQATVTIVRNPTAGDLITDATAVAMNANRNFGSSKSLKTTTLAYKGKVSGTITGGDDFAQFYMGNNARLYATINMELPRGSSMALKVAGTTVAGSAYGALVLHAKDAERV